MQKPPAPTINPFTLWHQNKELREYVEVHGAKGVKALHRARERLGELATNERVSAEIQQRTRHRYHPRSLRRLNAERRKLIEDWTLASERNNENDRRDDSAVCSSVQPAPATDRNDQITTTSDDQTTQQEAVINTSPPGHFVPSGMHDMVLTPYEETKRGGQPSATSGAKQERQQAASTVPSDEPGTAETYVSAPVVQNEDGMIRGPFGAIMYPNGAAFVPAGAEAWYNAMMQAQARQQAEQSPAETDVSAPTQIALDNAQLVIQHERDQGAAKPAPSARRRRTQKRAEFVQPGELVGRIIAATRKAEKLEKGNATQKRQARAIRYQIEQLDRKLATLRAELDSAEAQAEGQPEAASSQPLASRPSTSREVAPPLGFLPDVRVPDAQGVIARLRQRQISLPTT